MLKNPRVIGVKNSMQFKISKPLSALVEDHRNGPDELVF